MERAKEIFSYFSKIFSIEINITYLSSENNMDNELLKIRLEREKKSVELFKNNIVQKINSINEFIEWFYVEHNAYNCCTIGKTTIDEKTKKSY